MDAQISPKERAELAEKSGVNEQYLYQCLSGRRNMDATQASVVESKTEGRIRRWQLRRDWNVTWPELVGADGAPTTPTDHQEAA
jgi:DNA-binding transcriptional regulator YdaS (Cro superfamily)